MKKLSLFPSIILLAFLATSCDSGVEYEKIVQNNSDYNIKVFLETGIWVDTIFISHDTLTIYKNSSVVIDRFVTIGDVRDFQDCKRNAVAPMPIFVYYEYSVKLIPNIHEMNYWNFSIIKQYRNGGGICECRIILTNEILAEY